MKIKYDNQDKEWSRCLSDKEKQIHARQWLKKNTLDHWRHKRMLTKTYLTGSSRKRFRK